MRKEIVTYNGILSAGKFNGMAALGSSNFLYYDSGNFAKIKKEAKVTSTTDNEELADEYCSVENSDEYLEIPDKDTSNDSTHRNLRLRKKRIQSAVYKMWNTSAAKKRFVAVTITFPKEMNNEIRLKALNTILTRWRTKLLQNRPFPYVWVRERHKSGLYHYHLITTAHIDYNKAYDVVNTTCIGYCGKGIVRSGLFFDNIISKGKTTAADVAGYVSKVSSYVSKSNCNKGERIMGMSRLVNAMFSSVVQECVHNENRRGDLVNIQVTEEYSVDFYFRNDKFKPLERLIQLNDYVTYLYSKSEDMNLELSEWHSAVPAWAYDYSTCEWCYLPPDSRVNLPLLIS